MWIIYRLFLGTILIGLSALLAGGFGMVHNQISFAAASAYFYDLKFTQFRIPQADQDAWGAALVGWHASWWMGAILGALLWLVGMRIRRHGRFLAAYFKSMIFVIIFALAIAVAAILLAKRFATNAHIPDILNTYGSKDPLSFFHAAIMHEASYMAAALGLVLAYFLFFRPAIRTDRKERSYFG